MNKSKEDRLKNKYQASQAIIKKFNIHNGFWFDSKPAQKLIEKVIK